MALAPFLAVIAAMAAAQPPSPPCAACVSIRVTVDDARALGATASDLHGLPVIILADRVDETIQTAIDALSRRSATVGVELPLRALPAIDPNQLKDVAYAIVDARDAGVISAEVRYAVQTFSTAMRAVAGAMHIGVDMLPSQLAGISSLRAYLDFVVTTADSAATIRSQLPGIEIWTASTAVAESAVDAVSAAPTAASDRTLVAVAGTSVGLATTIAELRGVLPAGLTPLPDVGVQCDAPCDVDVYLHPQTLDAVALVHPAAAVSRLRVTPSATDVTVLGGVRQERHGAEIDIARTTAPFVLRIRGWRGENDAAFASDVRVSGSRTLTVDEIIARHQAARGRQTRVVQSLISTGSTVLTFQVPGFAAPFTVTANTRLFNRDGDTTVEQTNIRVNGLALAQRPGAVPRLPLLEPERVSTPPLAITLTEAYRYEFRGVEAIDGREAFVVSFEPRVANQSRYAGRAWIDAATFGMARIDAVQTGLRGPISASRQVDEYARAAVGSGTAWLPSRSEIFQIYAGPAESTPIHRVVAFDRREINPADYDAQLNAALRSNAVMLRDTPNGYRFLLPDNAGSEGDIRRVSTSNVERITAAIVGGLFDPNISVPLVFAGISYVDFNLLHTGAQLNVFFGGTYGRFSVSTRPLFGAWRLTGDGSGVAVAYNDRAFRGGVEQYSENIRQRPAQLSAALLGTIAPAVRVRVGYDLAYTRYAAASTTAPMFAVPASTPVHGARLALEVEHGPWSVVGWSTVAMRQTWTPWGLTASPAQSDQRRFERFGATLARSIVWSPTAVARIEAAAMGGARLDRFSRFAFGTIDNPLRGYPSVSIRYDAGMAVRSAATWTPGRRLRVDGFADVGVAREADAGARVRAFPGFGGAIETPAPFGWLAAVEWGYGVKGVNTNGTIGTHVFRVSGYKVF